MILLRPFRVGDCVERIGVVHPDGMRVGDKGVVEATFRKWDYDNMLHLKGRVGDYNPANFKLCGDIWIDDFGITHNREAT